MSVNASSASTSSGASSSSSSSSVGDGGAVAALNLWHLKLQPALLTALTLAYTAVFVLSIVGNAVVMATVYRIRSMHTTINLLICNLSTADILMAIFCLPLNLISNTFTNWVCGRILCKAMPYLQGVAVAASVTTLSIIAFDRYLAICRPLVRHFSKKQTVICIAGIWIYVLILLSPWFITYDLMTVTQFNHTIIACRITMTGSFLTFYQLGVIFCMLYAAPLLFIIVCYTLVACKLNRRTANHEEFLRKSSSAQDKKQMSRLVKMLATVVLIFAISWLPLHAVGIVYFVKPIFWLLPYLEPGLPIVQWIGISNCCVNPWIYCAFSKSYRNNFINTLRCRTPPSGSTHSRWQQQQMQQNQQQQQHSLRSHSGRPQALNQNSCQLKATSAAEAEAAADVNESST